MPLTFLSQVYYTPRMKLASIIVFLLFCTAPLWLRVSLIVWRLATQGVKGADSLFVPSDSPRLPGPKKKAVLAFAFLYFAAFIASGLWMLLELTDNIKVGGSTMTTRGLTFLATIIFVGMGGTLALSMYLMNRVPGIGPFGILKKVPRPEVDPSSPEWGAWKKRYYAELNKQQNYFADHAGHYFGRLILLIVGASVLMMAAVVLLAVLIH